MKRINDFEPLTGILPYSSEIFGVYQPMIGWRSKRITERIHRGFANDLAKASRAVTSKLLVETAIDTDERGLARVRTITPGELHAGRQRSTGTFIGDAILHELPDFENYRPEAWEIIRDDKIQGMLDDIVVPRINEWAERAIRGDAPRGTSVSALVQQQAQREAALAGLVLHLASTKQHDALQQMFYKQDKGLQAFMDLATTTSPLEYMDPNHDIDRVGLSPVGIVHLFRQYFFEFDSFLGTPVGHVWMSPGSTVELLEITTRRTLVEKTLATELEMVLKTEKSSTDEDEISDAVKQDNRSDTKFAMNASANQGWIGGSASASTSINLDSTQQKSRETAHRHMRQQTEKLSTEIRKNFKSTFRTVTETTDTSSKRYVLTNSGNELINYELRRKMRQVGVQVQDIGSYLCWQTYVDDPGKQLGISKMIHIAKDPEIANTPPPEAIPMPGDHHTQKAIDIPFVPATEDTEPDEDMDEAYRDGVEVNTDFNEGDPEAVQWQFPGIRVECDQAGYEFKSLTFDNGGADIEVDIADLVETSPGIVSFTLRVRHVNFRNSAPIRINADVTWQAAQAIRDEINAKNQAAVSQFKEQTRREYQKAFVDAARDRVNKASRIEQRPHDDLREEERIVVYRALIQELLTKGIPMPDDRTRHVVSELLNAIFDIDKMLYFVAPEWWRPRLHHSHQALGALHEPGAGGGGAGGAGGPKVPKGALYGMAVSAAMHEKVSIAALTAPSEDTTLDTKDVVSWGGVGEHRADNYYITDESEPARLGSSLGWLLQLDGDSMRNAFLNAPWVKAVIPIRPGQERAALNWLQRVHVEGSDGLDDDYVAPPDELAGIPHGGPTVTIRDALDHLCTLVAEKHAASLHVGLEPSEEINDDNKVSATPIDKVYEHGFYPLQGGFRAAPSTNFEVFDQWVEILPTDQVVPVEVKYDPKTGRQL